MTQPNKIKKNSSGLPRGAIPMINTSSKVPISTLKAVLQGKRRNQRAIDAIRDFCERNRLPIPTALANLNQVIT